MYYHIGDDGKATFVFLFFKHDTSETIGRATFGQEPQQGMSQFGVFKCRQSSSNGNIKKFLAFKEKEKQMKLGEGNEQNFLAMSL